MVVFVTRQEWYRGWLWGYFFLLTGNGTEDGSGGSLSYQAEKLWYRGCIWVESLLLTSNGIVTGSGCSLSYSTGMV